MERQNVSVTVLELSSYNFPEKLKDVISLAITRKTRSSTRRI